MPRCPWAATEPNITYHDEEWGVPVHDDRLLFEFLILEGAQAGLSWTTILNKRDNYRKAFDGFRPEKIARYGARDVKRLLGDAGIVRNRLKIVAAIENAKTFLAVRKEFGTFDAYLWSFVGGKPIQNRWQRMADVPARTAESDAMSRDLQRRGFKFVGSTICYALMQATGMVNDHLVTCPRHAQLGGARRRVRTRPYVDLWRSQLMHRPRAPARIPLDAVGSVQRRRRWSGRCGMLIIARGTFRVRFGGSFGSPPGFHRRRKLSATFRRKIELFFRFLDSSRFLRLRSLGRLGSCASGASGRFSRGFQLLCCFRRL